MTDNQRYVLEICPTARCLFNYDTGVFKIYHNVGECRVALSRGTVNEGTAWDDAADALRVKAAQQQISATCS